MKEGIKLNKLELSIECNYDIIFKYNCKTYNILFSNETISLYVEPGNLIEELPISDKDKVGILKVDSKEISSIINEIELIDYLA